MFFTNPFNERTGSIIGSGVGGGNLDAVASFIHNHNVVFGDVPVTVYDVHKHLKNSGNSISVPTVRRHMQKLASMGFVMCETVPHRPNVNKVLYTPVQVSTHTWLSVFNVRKLWELS